MANRLKLEQWIGENTDSQLLGIIVAVIAAIVTLVLFALWRRRKSAGRSVLLTGLSGAGKTWLFASLLESNIVGTYTSVKENIGDIIINDKRLRVVDIPGHERLRYKFFDKHKKSAKCVVFVIDSATLQKEIRDVAEFLYTLLSDPILQGTARLVVLCNKQDETMAKGIFAVRKLLEKEINLLRVTKTNQLEATDASLTNSFIGKRGKDFEFAHLNTKVDFAESGYGDFDKFNNWLKIMV